MNRWPIRLFHDEGNRTWRDYGSGTTDLRYKWDYTNRMESCCNETKGAKYMYCADGMRVKKVDGLTPFLSAPRESSPEPRRREMNEVNRGVGVRG